MKIKIVSVDKTREKYIREGEQLYLKRLNSFVRSEIIELSPRIPGSLTAEQTKAKQAEEIFRKIGSEKFLVLLDEKGELMTSVDFARILEERMNQGAFDCCFLVGGAYGVADSVKSRADRTLSLSRMTFTYQMSRFLLIEQLYRSFTIIKGMPYHKD